MKLPFVLAVLVAVAGIGSMPMQEQQPLQSSKKTAVQERTPMTPIAGKTIRWTFIDGPTAGITFEHSFNEDGSVTWRALDGPWKGATATEKSYAGVKVNDKTWVVSYLAASGHTLTVVLNLDNGQAIAFASNDKSWYEVHGTFKIVN